MKPSWKVGAFERNSRKAGFNALRFATRKEAEAYASDLYSRWMGCERVEVFPSSDPVTHRWDALACRAFSIDNIPVTNGAPV